MAQSEKEFQNAVVEYAHLNGWLVHHGRAAQVREGKWVTPIQGDPGFPDLVLARSDKVVVVELKAQKGKLSKAQNHWLYALEGYGEHNDAFLVKVWRPSDWDEIEQTLKRRT